MQISIEKKIKSTVKEDKEKKIENVKKLLPGNNITNLKEHLGNLNLK